MLIKWIRNSLTAKIFLITSILLIMVSALTYSFIAYFMPKSYSSELKAGLEVEVQQLIDKLRQTDLGDSGTLFDEFRENNDVYLQLYDNYGEWVDIPTNDGDILSNDSIDTERAADQSDADWSFEESVDDSELGSEDNTEVSDPGPEDNTNDTEPDTEDNTDDTELDTEDITEDTELDTGDNPEDNAIEYYRITFADYTDEFELTVIGNVREVNQAVEALERILPWLIITIISVSLLSSVLYSFYITKPVVKISQTSKKMSQLDFSWYCEDKRTDEIGILAGSLNELSEKLSAALTELQEANASLQDDIEKERELEQKRLEFFSAVSHELKTPITVIKGQLEGMRYNVGAYKDRDKYLSHAYMVACSMEDIVLELLNVSRMESSDFVLKAIKFNFSSLIKECIGNHEDLYMMKEMELNCHISEDLTIEGDQKLMSKVINNILNNAITYSSAASQLNINAYEEDGWTILQVENTGVHIPSEAIPQLFTAFYRVEKSRNRSTGGSGLGLYIVKMILDLHHGEYNIANSENGVLVSIRVR